ncbi:hypothetical protein Sango_2323600 [Sesamum angolense]|uniref:Reverse transcriptase Ty1/copia-type domain-containing protein n=1 Tax=Sesamum angolense TaxID=2727404 RepID=A0AAE1WB21_9LAMI|nr:hypothetical protein Sango_2323600 [Sesamum angolense]
MQCFWKVVFQWISEGYDFVKNDFDLCVYKKDLGEASYILKIRIFRNRSKRILGMTQNSYVEKVLKKFKMEHSKRGFLLMRHGVKLSKKQSPKTDEELERMLVTYASVVGSIQAIAQDKKSRSHHRSKHILRRYHLLREMVGRAHRQTDKSKGLGCALVGGHETNPVDWSETFQVKDLEIGH